MNACGHASIKQYFPSSSECALAQNQREMPASQDDGPIGLARRCKQQPEAKAVGNTRFSFDMMRKCSCKARDTARDRSGISFQNPLGLFVYRLFRKFRMFRLIQLGRFIGFCR